MKKYKSEQFKYLQKQKNDLQKCKQKVPLELKEFDTGAIKIVKER